LVLFMTVFTSLPCGAEEETIEWPIGLIDALGDYTFYEPHGTARRYWLSDARDDYFEADVYAPEAVYISYGGIMIHEFPKSVVDLRTDEGIEWEAWQIDQTSMRRLFVQNCCYTYTAEGELYSISIRLSDCWVEISDYTRPCNPMEAIINHLPDYPQEGPETMLSRLLDPAKAPDAIAELTARAEGTYVEPTPPSYASYFWCISCGAVVAGVGTWIVTYLVMRKRRGGGAVAAAADTPTDTSTDTSTDTPTAPAAENPPAPDDPPTP